jgi:hypothetical protein
LSVVNSHRTRFTCIGSGYVVVRSDRAGETGRFRQIRARATRSASLPKKQEAAFGCCQQGAVKGYKDWPCAPLTAMLVWPNAV